MDSQSSPGTEAATDLWALPSRQAWFFLSALATGIVVVFLRLVQLDQLQNEVYGDISIVYEYVRNIREWRWPTYFDVSAGPLYHYLITPLIALTGPSYLGLKLASVMVSLGVLALTYALARRLMGDEFALLAMGIAGVSSWLLIFSRLGNSQILVPLLAVGALWLALRYSQEGRRSDLIASAIVSALGLYVYPQSFILPAVTFITLLCLRLAGAGRARRRPWRHLALFCLVSLLCALPFALIFAQSARGFLTGYIGVKLQARGNGMGRFLENVVRALLAFHIQGDVSSRSNISGLPHLDPLSGLLALAGVVFWLLPARRRWSPALFLPFVLLQLPSVLVLSDVQEVPSASRTLGVAPFLYILVASGLWWVVQLIARRARRYALAVGGLLLVVLLMLNADRYFRLYIQGLPYHNTPVARYITDYVDMLPGDTQVYLIGCCWRDGMPEPKSILNAMARPANLHPVDDVSVLTCDWLQFLPGPTVFIWNDANELPTPQLAGCRDWLPAQTFVSRENWPIFRAARVYAGQPAAPDASSAGAEDLVYSLTKYHGQTVGVRHSPLDIGQVSDLFDGKPDTLLRGAAANPLVLELRFGEPVTATAASLTLGTMQEFRIKVTLVYADNSRAELAQSYADLPADPTVEVLLGDRIAPIKVARVEIEDLAPPGGDAYHIHVRELALR